MNKLVMMGVCLVGIALHAAETNEVKTAANGVDSKRKERIAQMVAFIKKCGLGYEIKEDSDVIRVGFSFPGGRTQIVYVDSELHDYEGYKTIHISSTVCCGRLTKAMLMDMVMQWNKVGFWRADVCPQNEYNVDVEFAMQIPADIEPKNFSSLCELAASQADKVEARWTDRDDF